MCEDVVTPCRLGILEQCINFAWFVNPYDYCRFIELDFCPFKSCTSFVMDLVHSLIRTKAHANDLKMTILYTPRTIMYQLTTSINI